MPLQAEVAEFLRHFTGSPGQPAPLAPEEMVDHVEDHRVGDAAIPVRVYAPKSATPLPLIVYYFSDSVDLTRQVGATIKSTFHDSERRCG